MIENGLQALETEMFALAATETKDGIACNTGGACSYGEPASMTLVQATDADRALMTEAATEAVLPAYGERCGAECTATWNQTIGAAMGFSIK